MGHVGHGSFRVTHCLLSSYVFCHISGNFGGDKEDVGFRSASCSVLHSCGEMQNLQSCRETQASLLLLAYAELA